MIAKNQLEHLKGQDVVVVYRGLRYRGRLVGASDETLDLKTETQWLALPLDGITSVEPSSGAPGTSLNDPFRRVPGPPD